MFSSLSLSTPAARCSSAGFYSIGRSSIGRFSIGRFSVERVLQSPKTTPITLSDLVLDCLKQLTIHFDELGQDERNEAWKVLDRLLLSAQSEQEIENTIKHIAENFSHESHLKAIIISATNSVIVEHMLQKAHKANTTEVSRLSYWKTVKINSIEAVQRAAAERKLHLADIETITTNCIVELTSTTGKEAALHPFLGYLDTYLKFKLAEENLAETIFELCGDKAQLTQQLAALRKTVLPVEFDSISVETYVTASLEKRTKEEACRNLKDNFSERLLDLNVVEYLKEATTEELRVYLAEQTEEIIKLDYVFEDKVGEVEYSSQDVRHLIEQHRLAKNQGNPASVTKKILRFPLDLLKRDGGNCTALDCALQLAVKSKNSDIVKRVLERAQHDQCLDALVACSVEKMSDENGNIHDLPGLFYLVIQGKCLFDNNFVAYIRDEDGASDEDGYSRLVASGDSDTSYVDDENLDLRDEYSSEIVNLKFSKLFDEANRFIVSPELIDYGIQHADAEAFQLLLKNILSQQWRTARQEMLFDYLKKAVEFGRCAHIAKILTFADKYECAELVVRKTLFAVRTNEEQLENLIAGAYLYEPKYGGLFNDVFFYKLRSVCDLENDAVISTPMSDISMSTIATQTVRLTSTEAVRAFDAECQGLRNKLTQLQSKKDFKQKLLEYADDETLARFIEEAGKPSWPHNAENRAQDIREELKKRYVGEGKPTLPPKIKEALQKNWDVRQDADKLATYYDTATRHIVEQYQSDPTLYTKKADTMSRWAKDMAQAPMSSVTTKAKNFANQLLQPNQSINLRRPRLLVCDPHKYNRTQRLVSAASDGLDKKPSTWNRAKGAIDSVIDRVMGWNHQRSKEILELPNLQLEVSLSAEQLYTIPITQQEKEACVERAVLARGAFKKTLDYLKNSSNNVKREIMETYLQAFIDGYDKAGRAYGKERLKTDIKEASAKDYALGKRKFLSKMWSSPSKTGRTAIADLAKLDNMIKVPVMAS